MMELQRLRIEAKPLTKRRSKIAAAGVAYLVGNDFNIQIDNSANAFVRRFQIQIIDYISGNQIYDRGQAGAPEFTIGQQVTSDVTNISISNLSGKFPPIRGAGGGYLILLR